MPFMLGKKIADFFELLIFRQYMCEIAVAHCFVQISTT